jgi:D-arabinose 1-dehydrogenase-like Zn-dependent alcohol dehydrogenase
MRAVRYEAYGEPPSVVDVPEPTCPPGGAVLTVRATGVCRSDWHAWQGHEPVALPHVPGHELAGVVASVGTGVTRWRAGERVTVPFVCGCGECSYCAAGDAQVCPHQTQPGFTGPGSFAERVAIHAADHNLVALPEAVGFVTAASLGCRFATAFRALTAHARLAGGEWLAVHGCGGVGLSAIQIGLALGARVVAVDLVEAALDRARALGALTAPPEAIPDLTGGGAHVSIDAAGTARTAVASVRCLRRRGRHVQAGLLHGAAATPPLPMDLVIAHELAVLGTHGMAARDYPPMLAMVADRTLRPDLLVGKVIGLDDAPAALTSMAGPGMTVIELP